MNFFQKHSWVKILIGLALVPVIAIVGLILVAFLMEWNAARSWNHNRLPFDQEVWLAGADSKERDPIRLRMVDDLLEHHDLKGLTRKQVEDLLGPRTETEYFKGWDMVYWLGPERSSIRIDSEWLVIRFDKNGVVSERRIIND